MLDTSLRPVPCGVPGELYLAGAGLARGYLGRPDLTAAAFVPHPFSTRAGERMYRTGDRVAGWPTGTSCSSAGSTTRSRSPGTESNRARSSWPSPSIPPSSRWPWCRTTSAVATGFVAYIRCDDPSGVTLAALHDLLRTTLPDYLLPAALVVLPEFPLTTSGKVDRRALPRRRPTGPRSGRVTSRRVPRPRRSSPGSGLGRWATPRRRTGRLRRAGRPLAARDAGGRPAAQRARARRRRARHPESAYRRGAGRRTAGAAHDGAAAAKPGVLVWFRPAGTGAPVFLVHPGGGSVHWYRELSVELAPGRAVAALQYPGLADPADAGLSVGDLARLYLAEIRAAQPAGPVPDLRLVRRYGGDVGRSPGCWRPPVNASPWRCSTRRCPTRSRWST